MSVVRRWRKQNSLKQVDAASLLNVSQSYLSRLEKGERPLTAALRARMKSSADGATDDWHRAQLGALGYPGFAHLGRSRRPRPGAVLIGVLTMSNADARVVEALPWLVGAFQDQLNFELLVRQAKLRNLQNRLGLVLEAGGVDSPEGRVAVRELERARLMQEDTLCWDTMPVATRVWMRANRSSLAARWNVLTRLGAESAQNAA